MNSAACQNKGFILEGFPRSQEDAKSIFNEKKELPKKAVEGEEAPAEGEQEPQFEYIINEKIVPQYAIALEADDASLGGYFVGKLHRDGGIKMINKSTGQPLEVQGSEVIITAPAVNDQTKHNFNGKMMTNREILSKINSDGGGVSFADGGDIPAKIHTTDKEYEYGDKMLHDTDIAHSLGINSTLKKGKQQFYVYFF